MVVYVNLVRYHLLDDMEEHLLEPAEGFSFQPNADQPHQRAAESRIAVNVESSCICGGGCGRLAARPGPEVNGVDTGSDCRECLEEIEVFADIDTVFKSVK